MLNVRHSIAALVAAFATAAAAGAQQAGPAAPDTVVHAGRLIDGTSKTVQRGVSILVAGDRIVRVESGFVAPPGAKIVDLTNATVLQRVIFVMRGGQVYRDSASLSRRSAPEAAARGGGVE
jgi:imidazolonepropionase-like amidohydrolase